MRRVCVWLIVLGLGWCDIARCLGSTGDEKNLYGWAETVHRALIHENNAPDILEIMRTAEKLGIKPDGKSAETVKALARGLGYEVTEIPLLTLSELKQSAVPLILEVKTAVDSKADDLRLVVLQSHSGESAILWLGEQRLEVRWEDVMPVWNHHAMIISRETISPSIVAVRAQYVTYTYPALVCAITILAIAVRRRGRSRVAGLKSSLVQAAAIVSAALILGGAAYFSVTKAEFASVSTGTTAILWDLRDEASPVSAVNVVEIEQKNLAELMSSHDVLFVDARGDEDFTKSRVRGAIGLQNFTESAIRLNLAGIPKGQYIVVYCANSTCPRGRAATASLMKAGFQHVVNYREGWAELQNSSLLKVDSSPLTSIGGK